MCESCGGSVHSEIFKSGIETGLSHLDINDNYYPGLNPYQVVYDDMEKAVTISGQAIKYGEPSFDKYMRELLDELIEGIGSGNQREHITEVLRNFSDRKFKERGWWGNLTKQEIEELYNDVKAFYLPHTKMIEEGLREAYVFGKFTKQLTDNMSLSDARKKVAGKALSKFDEARIGYIQDTAGLFWDRAIEKESDKAKIKLLKYNKDVTTEVLKNPDRKAWRSLTSDIYHSINRDKTIVMRDLDRIVRTETAYSQNSAILYAGKDGGHKYGFFMVRPTACKICKSTYLDKNGKPKRFLIDDLLDVPRDANWGKKAKDNFIPTVTLHPWCYCRLMLE
jgi:hypothetical protein